MSSFGLENKNQLCFEYGVEQGRCLIYSEIYTIGMALDSLKGMGCIAMINLLRLRLIN